VKATRNAPGDTFICWVVYTHLLTVCAGGIVSYLGRKGLYDVCLGTINCEYLLFALELWAIFSMFLYPAIVWEWLARGKRSSREIVILVLLEGLLLFAQAIAILPFVQ
jgi:hypothetical protein